MSEADAEDGLHGLDEPLAIKNDTRLNIEFAFLPTASSLEEARPSPVSAHSILKKSPPREKEKAWKGGTGRGRSAESARRWSDCESHHAIGAYALV